MVGGIDQGMVELVDVLADVLCRGSGGGAHDIHRRIWWNRQRVLVMGGSIASGETT